jgi:glutaminyl-peptide cyclotransferase
MARRTVPLAAVSLVMVLLAAVVVSCGERERACDGAVPVPQKLVPEVVRTVPHAMDAFTEGLLVRDGKIYESTGLEGRSSLRVLDLQTGAEQRRAELPPNLFGEGLDEGPGGTLVQLTWKNRTALVWDRATLRQTGTLRYRGEGWGITTVPSGDFVMSNGSDRLTTRSPDTFDPVRTTTVRRNGGPTDQLNELEFARSGGRAVVWANRWQTNEILRVDLECGVVTAVVNASELAADARRRAVGTGTTPDVLNGIAAVPGTDRFLVTGKLWSSYYEVRFRRA